MFGLNDNQGRGRGTQAQGGFRGIATANRIGDWRLVDHSDEAVIYERGDAAGDQERLELYAPTETGTYQVALAEYDGPELVTNRVLAELDPSWGPKAAVAVMMEKARVLGDTKAQSAVSENEIRENNL